MIDPLAYLIGKADTALYAGHYRHALWLVERARLQFKDLDQHALAAVSLRLQRIETAANAGLVE